MKKYNLYTQIKNQRRKRINKIINLSFLWCLNKWGYRLHKHELELDITYREDTPAGVNCRGEYCCEYNEITIYPSEHRIIRDLIDTVIHEFTHQRQDMSDYHKILNEKGYDVHPLEMEANEVAKNYRKECWDNIKNKINS